MIVAFATQDGGERPILGYRRNKGLIRREKAGSRCFRRGNGERRRG
ncbi:hypothetical protein GCWU000341_00306 [Oribacterium sp. oral taxon 078 str. F0262]|nr:hypothetical protein GCWU000341_00306 [Oribacterium sp. oral taxon 078 str. F0262]